MDRYDSYKDSGVEWIGEIPSSWVKTKLKYKLQEVVTGGTPDTSNDSFWSDQDNGINWISISDITSNGREITNTKKFISEKGLESKKLQILSVGSLIYSIYGSIGKISRLGIPSTIHQGILGLKTNSTYNTSFLEYYLIYFKEYVSLFSSSNTQENLNQEKVSNFDVPVPPLSEQSQIVQFLDEKTLLIDSLIKKTKRKIELLKEERTSLINHTVTKGLNPNVEMKDSGVEWIGEIPSHWRKSCVRYVTQEHRQGYYSSDSYTENGLRVVRITDLNDDRTISIENSPFYQLSEIEQERFILRNGDFLFPRTGGVGRFGIFYGSTLSIYGSFLIRFRFSDKVINQYMRYYFDSGIFLNQILSEIHGGVNQNVHVENIKDCKFFYPNIKEQQQIVSFLDEKTSTIDKTIELEEKRIYYLKEYRQSLISEVVTGKIKVVN